MPAYPSTLATRFATDLARLYRRVRTLEARTASIDSGMPLAALPGTIDPSYSSGDPKVNINGQGLTGPYPHLASYTPVASDAVLVLPVPLTANTNAGTYIVLGKVT